MRYETEAVRAYLHEALGPHGIDPDTVHVNEIAYVVDREVVRTRRLLEESLHWLEQGEEPTYDIGLIGLFHRPDTFEPEHRVEGLRLQDIERMIGRMLLALR